MLSSLPRSRAFRSSCDTAFPHFSNKRPTSAGIDFICRRFQVALEMARQLSQQVRGRRTVLPSPCASRRFYYSLLPAWLRVSLYHGWRVVSGVGFLVLVLLGRHSRRVVLRAQPLCPWLFEQPRHLLTSRNIQLSL